MGTLSKGTGAVAGISQRQGQYKRSAPAFLIILAALVLLLGFSMILSVCTGIAGGSFKVFAETVMYPARASGVGMIMLEMRMPRALAAGLTGMAFALSGAVMQGITRNPLSDAGLLGINAGAGFFVVLSAILFPAAPDIVKTCAAFAGAALAVFMVYGFGAGKHRSESFRFILAGAAVSPRTILIFVPQGKIQKRGTDMDQNVNYYGIILLLRQLRESGSFSEKELRRVAARIAADSGADIMISL